MKLNGKRIYRQDRSGDNVKTRGGGVCVYLTDKLGAYCTLCTNFTKCSSDYEILCLDIKKPGLRHMTIICLYRPPAGKIKPCIDYLKTIFPRCNSEIWLLGDFNIDFLDRVSTSRSNFQALFANYGLKQLIQNVTRPTNRSGSCIDWIVTNSLFVKQCGVSDDYISDHLTTYCIRKKDREKHSYVYREVRDLSNFDGEVYRNMFMHLDWDFVNNSEDMEYIWSELYKRMYDILKIMCPFRKYKQREYVTPWITPEIYRAMRKRDAFIKLFKQTGHVVYLETSRRCRNYVNGLIRKSKSDYIQRQLNMNEKNPKKFWRIIKGLLNRKVDSTSNARFIDPITLAEVDHGKEADFLNEYFINIVQKLNIPPDHTSMDAVYNIDDTFSFEEDMPTLEEIHSLIREIDINKSSCVDKINTKFCKEAMLSIPGVICTIMCKSLRTGTIPVSWTRGIINVIPKGGDLSDPGNWRPITQTSIFAKLLEKLVHKRVLSYLMRNNILTDYQFGFLPGRSTQLAIFELLKQVYSAFNSKKIFGSICLDVSKAFDCINHVKLFDKMKSCGFSDSVLSWFHSYFSRTQVVRFNNDISDVLAVGSGIGQGTILGPLIFVFYINDVINNIANLRINMYADDCLIYTVGNNWDLMFPKLQEGLRSCEKWCCENSLKLNARKSKALVLGTNYKISDINLRNRFILNDQFLDYTNVYNYLGILLDQKMSLMPLLHRLKNVIRSKIYSLVKIRDLITTKCALTIYKQTILPLFDYSGFIIISCNISDRSDLQTFQNNALRICFNVRLRDRVSVERMHRRAKLTSLEQRRQVQLLSLMFIYKERHDNVRRVYNRRTRAANVYSFVRERYNCVKYRTSPYYKGSLLWDTLPPEMKICRTLLDFKKGLKNIYSVYNATIT